MERLPDLARSLLEFWPLKALVAFAVWAFAPWRDEYGALLALILLDTATGIWASLKEGKRFRSALLKEGFLGKVFLYFSSLLLAALVDRVMKVGALGFTLWFLTATEGLSVLENLQRIRPGWLGGLEALFRRKP